MGQLSNLENNTFGDWAYLAIAKHYKKMLKHESGVLAGEDPEELHQMRVGMRRLRTAIAGFAPALDLPKPAQEKKVAKIARKLGELRDLDVMQETIEQQYLPQLPKDEQKAVKKALKDLQKKRKKAFKKVSKTLTGKTYQKMTDGFNTWLEQPTHHAIAALDIDLVLPDLLLPQLSEFLLHPGWFVGVKQNANTGFIFETPDPPTVYNILDEQAAHLHDLRKEAKRTRYQMELFSQFYGDNYDQYIQDIKQIQSLLGEIQDSFVLSEFLVSDLDFELEEELPVFLQKLQEVRFQKWQDWQPLQKKFLYPETQMELRKIIIERNLASQSHPTLNEKQDTSQTEEKSSQVHEEVNGKVSSESPQDQSSVQS
ncbi:CHAD domain-containing protein [Spirulina sp. CS-785/01]|uniref:CHAD domain-containing protein n=1 Tax=Spirulina sp. CS-785/01 TaxID=3021716 RepID=UPI00232F2717|nr:CHAD domain-containing protein [Spirulina sp. CS-785/01]MDB9314406.1 CHAD domain-containing protein [Spirulina sp. CS-785/01]